MAGSSYLEFRSNLIALLKSDLGIDIDFNLDLGLAQLEDLRFAVYVAPPNAHQEGKTCWDGEEFLFNDAKEAVDFFLQKREELQLGFDFERTSGPEQAIAQLERIAQDIPGDYGKVLIDGTVDRDFFQQLRALVVRDRAAKHQDYKGNTSWERTV